MLLTIWNTLFYAPLYNLLLVIIAIMPNGNVGLAIIIITILVKLVLFPLTQRSIESQLKMKAVEPEIAEIKTRITDKTEQNKAIYLLYKEKNLNPFSSCLLILVQIPVIIALYQVFLNGLGETSLVNAYSFVRIPESFNLNFLGFLDLGVPSIILAIGAGITQYFQGKLAQSRQGKPTGEGMSGQIAKSMQTQMLYVLPVFIAFISYRLAGAVALYWIVSNLFTIGQELYTLRKMRKNAVTIA